MNGVERVALAALPAMILEGSTRKSRIADDAPAITRIPLWAARLLLLYCVPMNRPGRSWMASQGRHDHLLARGGLRRNEQ
jgi:hypothetical protein